MNKLLLLIMFAASGPVMAQELCLSSFTVNTVTISSSVATLVDSAAIRLEGRKWMEVQDLSTDTVHCAQSAAMATTSTGRLLAASGGAWEVPVTDGFYTVTESTYPPHISRTFVALGLYCIGSGTNITSTVALSQCK